MFFSDNEKRVMEKLFLSINVNPSQIYILTYSDGDIIEAQVDTCYETDNQRPRKNYRKIVIPDTITYLGKKYKVTAIKAGACRKQPKLKQVVIGKNVKTIGKQAFYQSKKLKKVQIKSKCLQKVGKQAFQGTHRKIVIKIPKGKKVKYKN